MKKRYGDKVEFLGVYVREAHPTDGWRMQSNDKAGVAFAQPATKKERDAIAAKCCEKLKMSVRLLVDEIDDRVGHLYSGMPDRLYLIDKGGRIAYKGGRGPFGFKPGELEQSIIMMLIEQTDAKKTNAIPLLPTAEEPIAGPLPAWAHALAPAMPKTVAAMLELDYIHRAKSPLDAKLRAKMRWVAAHANRSLYGEAYALADLKRAGASEDEMRLLQGESKQWPAEERAALTFARKLTEAAYKVTDEEVAELRQKYGDAKIVAMVQLLAYANFQDRLTHALGLAMEEGGPLPPMNVRFRKPFEGGVSAPGRAAPADGSPQREQGPPLLALRASDAEWKQLDFDFLKKQMEGQKARQPRIPVPPFESIRKYLPSSFPKGKELKINWSLVCLSHQPELASAWTLCTRSFAEESHQDRVFEESVFWIVTRSLQCFY